MNNGLINTPSGQIHGAFAIKNNAQGLTQSVQQGVQSGSLTPQEHAAIAQERRENGQLLRADKAAGCVTPQERAQIRQNQQQIASQIAGFESGAPCC